MNPDEKVPFESLTAGRKWLRDICGDLGVECPKLQLITPNGKILGFYRPYVKRIELVDPNGMQLTTLFHELAHHIQFLDGGTRKRWHTKGFFRNVDRIHEHVWARYGLSVPVIENPKHGYRSRQVVTQQRGV